MPDFRVSDTAADHPKLRAAGIAAAGLWTMAGSWSMNPARLTDGWIPHHYVKSWPNGVRAARRLVEVGLWEEDEREGVRGYQFHDWAEYQRQRAAFEDDKRKARERMARRRSPNVRANRTVDNSVDHPGSESPQSHRRLIADSQANHRVIENKPVDNSTSSGNGSVFARTEHVGTNRVHPPSSPSPSPSPSGYAGQGGSAAVGASEPPPPRCPQHLNDDAPGPCGKCADARRANQRWHADQEARRLELAAALDAARLDPRQRCEHGTDGGRYVRPDTGTSPCALCRAESTRDTA